VPGRGRELAAALGRVGAWSFALQRRSAADEQAVARELEGMGYPVVWVPEGVGSKEVFAHSALLLAGTERLVVASGIANVWARDPMAMAGGGKTLGEAHPGRFVLGIGVSHGPVVGRRGGRYEQPLDKMRAYLDGMEQAAYVGAEPEKPVPLVLAALGPRMLSLAGAQADGAHSYFVPVEHTAAARERLGSDPLLAVEQTAVVETDPSVARVVARDFARHYLALPNYANNLRRLGWGEEDVVGEGSDSLIDAVIAWGDLDAIRGRIDEHIEAGADHVCVQFIGRDRSDVRLDDYRRLVSASAVP
jgi:probable F420-dependent oxidoreductase